MRYRLVVLAVFLLACVLPVVARPPLTPLNIDEALAAVAQDGEAVVIVALNDPPMRVAAMPAAAAFEVRSDKHEEVRDKVLDHLEGDLVAGGGLLTGAVVADETAAVVDVLHEYATSSGFIATVNEEGLLALATTPGVKSITVDRTFQLELSTNVPVINADDAWARTVGGSPVRGEAQTICILDTGIDYNHTAFAGRIVDTRCFLPSGCPDSGDATNASDDDPSSHGTHVAGIAAGNGSVTGVAPAAKLIIIKACNSAGSCYLSAMTAGVDYCVNASAQHNLSSISLSISDNKHYNKINDCPYDPSFEDAVNEAWGLGIVVSIAAGNNGTAQGSAARGIGWPSCVPNATSVGGTTSADALSGFQIGDVLDILAPGTSISSSIRNNAFGTKSGTSMATPFIAGASALLRQNEVLSGRLMRGGLLEDIMRNLSGTRVHNFSRIDVISVMTARNGNLSINRSDNTVKQRNAGSIRFIPTVDFSDVDRCVNISVNRIDINTTMCPQYDKNATLQLQNLTFAFMPVPLLNGSVCRDCNVTSYSGGVFEFNVSHFSAYSSGANSNLTINDSTDNALRVQYQNVTFLANYSNATSGEAINATCEIRFNVSGVAGSFETMLFNENRSLHEVNRTFSEFGNFSYTVRCNGTSFETINSTDALNITPDTTVPSVTQLSPVNGSSVLASNVVPFVYNASDDSGALRNCSVLVNSSVNGTAITPSPSVNQSINITLDNGVYAWQARCTDNANNTNTSGVFVVNVTVSNGAPTLILNLTNLTVVEDLNVSINLSAAFNDSNGDPLTFSASHNGSLVVFTDNATGNATVSGIANVSGFFSVTFTARDPLGATGQSNTITVNVTPINDRPTLASAIPNQSWSQGNNRTNAFDLDTYMNDIDNATLTFTSNGSSSITVTIDSVRHNVTFTNSGAFSGTEYVQFTASDGSLQVFSNTVKLTVSSSSTSSDSSAGAGAGGGGGTCTNDCFTAVVKVCSGNSAIACGFFDADSCLDLQTTACAATEQCSAGVCVSQECISVWSCSDWSACDNGEEKRACADTATCSLPTTPPPISRSCSPVAETQRPAAPPEVGLASNGTRSAVCGDNICSINEWCMSDCTTRNVKLPLLITLLGCIGAVIIHHMGGTAAFLAHFSRKP